LLLRKHSFCSGGKAKAGGKAKGRSEEGGKAKAGVKALHREAKRKLTIYR